MATMSSAVYAQEQAFLAKHLSEIPAVQFVSFARDGRRIYVSVVVSQIEDATEDRILDVQYEAIEKFVGNTFDFRIFERRGRQIGEIVSASSEILLDKTA